MELTRCEKFLDDIMEDLRRRSEMSSLNDPVYDIVVTCEECGKEFSYRGDSWGEVKKTRGAYHRHLLLDHLYEKEWRKDEDDE